jgi:hypothetical protein
MNLPPAYLSAIRDACRMDLLVRVQHKHKSGEFRFGARDAVNTSIFIAHEFGRELDADAVY